MTSYSKKVLLTGQIGFTGCHLSTYLEKKGFDVIGLKSDLLDKQSLLKEINHLKPSYVIHLAAKSFVCEENISDIYRVNIEGTLNLLDGLLKLKNPLKRVILASSATVYGNQSSSVLSENLCPAPTNHYGCSKLSMELLAKNYFNKVPILITRPFNYTGVGHADHFLIPKIVNAYKKKEAIIELGNLDVYREFNDVRDICAIYYELIMGKEITSDVVNICSGRLTSLSEIINKMNELAGYQIKVCVNPDFVRTNEIYKLSGNPEKMMLHTGHTYTYTIDNTLEWMYKERITG